MKTNAGFRILAVGSVMAGCLLFPGCTPASISTPTILSSSTPAATATATAVPIPLPEMILGPGENYFSLNGQPAVFYSRNISAFFPVDYGTEFDWSAYGGTRVVRFGLVNIVGMGGYPYTNTGQLNEQAVGKFEQLLDDAAAHGMYVIFWITGWGQWNTAQPTDWPNNPFNASNGGPAHQAADLFQDGSPANTMWFDFVDRLVRRWADRRNILAWDVQGEANLFEGVSQQQGIAFVEKMAKVVRAADPHHRPITASLGDVGTWPKFYDSSAIDFVQTHPYPENLDRAIIDKVHQLLARYHKPVMIGESGLNWEKPDSGVTTAPNAHVGIEHAIWAGVVSGAMNARALFWEDSTGIYFPTMRMNFLDQYAEAELPAARFSRDVDFTGFAPLTVHYPGGTKIWGAAVGNERQAIGWFRDAGSEPPNWDLLPKITSQSVTLDVPGTTRDWQVDFYDTKTGNALAGSMLLARQGKGITVPLPDFKDAIAFKLFVNVTGGVIPPPAPVPEPTAITFTSTDQAAGPWTGTVFGRGSNFAAVLNVTIQPGCTVGSVCGKGAFDWCSIDLVLNKINNDTLVFVEQRVNSTSTCTPGGFDHFRLQQDGTVVYEYDPALSGTPAYSGILRRP